MTNPFTLMLMAERMLCELVPSGVPVEGGAANILDCIDVVIVTPGKIHLQLSESCSQTTVLVNVARQLRRVMGDEVVEAVSLHSLDPEAGTVAVVIPLDEDESILLTGRANSTAAEEWPSLWAEAWAAAINPAGDSINDNDKPF